MDVLNSKVLVLNKGWTAIRIENFRFSITKVIKGTAKFVGEDFQTYDWEQWIEKYAVDNDKIKEEERGLFFRAKNISVKIPFVIVLKNYNKIPQRAGLRLCKKNVYIRDNGTCQYTGKFLKLGESNLDHVISRKNGGKKTWENIVLCDRRINTKKKDKLPSEVGLKLLRQPEKPKSGSGLYYSIKALNNYPDFWNNFIKNDLSKQ